MVGLEETSLYFSSSLFKNNNNKIAQQGQTSIHVNKTLQQPFNSSACFIKLSGLEATIWADNSFINFLSESKVLPEKLYQSSLWNFEYLVMNIWLLILSNIIVREGEWGILSCQLPTHMLLNHIIL